MEDSIEMSVLLLHSVCLYLCWKILLNTYINNNNYFCIFAHILFIYLNLCIRSYQFSNICAEILLWLYMDSWNLHSGRWLRRNRRPFQQIHRRNLHFHTWKSNRADSARSARLICLFVSATDLPRLQPYLRKKCIQFLFLNYFVLILTALNAQQAPHSP